MCASSIGDFDRFQRFGGSIEKIEQQAKAMSGFLDEHTIMLDPLKNSEFHADIKILMAQIQTLNKDIACTGTSSLPTEFQGRIEKLNSQLAGLSQKIEEQDDNYLQHKKRHKADISLFGSMKIAFGILTSPFTSKSASCSLPTEETIRNIAQGIIFKKIQKPLTSLSEGHTLGTGVSQTTQIENKLRELIQLVVKEELQETALGNFSLLLTQFVKEQSPELKTNIEERIDHLLGPKPEAQHQRLAAEIKTILGDILRGRSHTSPLVFQQQPQAAAAASTPQPAVKAAAPTQTQSQIKTDLQTHGGFYVRFRSYRSLILTKLSTANLLLQLYAPTHKDLKELHKIEEALCSQKPQTGHDMIRMLNQADTLIDKILNRAKTQLKESIPPELHTLLNDLEKQDDCIKKLLPAIPTTGREDASYTLPDTKPTSPSSKKEDAAPFLQKLVTKKQALARQLREVYKPVSERPTRRDFYPKKRKEAAE